MRLQEFVSYRLLPHTYSLQVADPGDAPGCEAYETPVVLDRQQYVVANPRARFVKINPVSQRSASLTSKLQNQKRRRPNATNVA